ncbi:hypothetical protein BC830DRAFT_135322 [Chytriomyces sp. MP71]|nr:hypothetical protein BC830DRAFT_135322 [Chytriomyces sp. MP71]
MFSGLSVSGAVKVAIPVALGLWTFKHIGKIIGRMEVLGKARKAAKKAAKEDEVAAHGASINTDASEIPVVTGIKGIDGFLDVITNFFEDLVDDGAGYVIWITIISFMLPGTTWFAFEGLREGGLSMHFAYPFFALLSQLLGISVVVPLLWLPLYLLTAPIVTGSTLSPLAIASVVVGIVLGQIPTLLMSIYPKSLIRTKAIQWFQISVALAWIPWAASPFAFAADFNNLHAPEATFFFTLGAAGVVVYVWILSQLLDTKNRIADRVWGLNSFDACKEDMVKLVGHYMFVDTIVLYAALVYAVAMKGGVEYGAYVVALTPVVGPGAAISFALGYLAM